MWWNCVTCMEIISLVWTPLFRVCHILVQQYGFWSEVSFVILQQVGSKCTLRGQQMSRVHLKITVCQLSSLILTNGCIATWLGSKRFETDREIEGQMNGTEGGRWPRCYCEWSRAEKFDILMRRTTMKYWWDSAHSYRWRLQWMEVSSECSSRACTSELVINLSTTSTTKLKTAWTNDLGAGGLSSGGKSYGCCEVKQT